MHGNTKPNGNISVLYRSRDEYSLIMAVMHHDATLVFVDLYRLIGPKHHVT